MAGLQNDESEEEQRETRKAYSGKIKDYLESKGIQDVTVVFDGEGKAVELDTIVGNVTSRGDDDEVAFSHTYHLVEAAAAPPTEPAPAKGPKADEEKPE